MPCTVYPISTRLSNWSICRSPRRNSRSPPVVPAFTPKSTASCKSATASNPTRRALFEFDKLVRSLYTLRYLRNPQLQRNIQRSQNRIESYHQLRSAIAQVGGKKELTGRTDLEIEVSNQCARLVANAIIYFNSAILSGLLMKYEASGHQKALRLLKRMSPAAWRHIHLNGHYTFRGDGPPIDLEAIGAGLKLG